MSFFYNVDKDYRYLHIKHSFIFKDPTTRREEKRGTISLNVITQLEHGQHVRVEWKGENGAHLHSDFFEKYIHFTGEKL